MNKRRAPSENWIEENKSGRRVREWWSKHTSPPLVTQIMACRCNSSVERNKRHNLCYTSCGKIATISVEVAGDRHDIAQSGDISGSLVDKNSLIVPLKFLISVVSSSSLQIVLYIHPILPISFPQVPSLLPSSAPTTSQRLPCQSQHNTCKHPLCWTSSMSLSSAEGISSTMTAFDLWKSYKCCVLWAVCLVHWGSCSAIQPRLRKDDSTVSVVLHPPCRIYGLSLHVERISPSLTQACPWCHQRNGSQEMDAWSDGQCTHVQGRSCLLSISTHWRMICAVAEILPSSRWNVACLLKAVHLALSPCMIHMDDVHLWLSDNDAITCFCSILHSCYRVFNSLVYLWIAMDSILPLWWREFC